MIMENVSFHTKQKWGLQIREKKKTKKRKKRKLSLNVILFLLVKSITPRLQ